MMYMTVNTYRLNRGDTEIENMQLEATIDTD